MLEKTLESPLDCKEVKPVHLKGNQSWIFIHWKDRFSSWSSNTLATWLEEVTHEKRPWCWERLKTGREGDDRGQDGWMASPTQWTWVWANSRRQWSTEKPGRLPWGPWGLKESDMTEQLNNNDLRLLYSVIFFSIQVL